MLCISDKQNSKQAKAYIRLKPLLGPMKPHELNPRIFDVSKKNYLMLQFSFTIFLSYVKMLTFQFVRELIKVLNIFGRNLIYLYR